MMDKDDRELCAWVLFGLLSLVALLAFPAQSMYRHEADAKVRVAHEINVGLTNLAKAITGDCDCVQKTD